MKIFDAIVAILCVEAIVLCLLIAAFYINLQSLVTLLIFNGFFVSLTFQFHGSLNKKFCLLILGNGIGLFWNFVFDFFSVSAVQAAADSFQLQLFKTCYTIFFPFLNTLWVISFWSLSLTAFRQPKTTFQETPP
jgi:hypothetical protein